MKKISALFFSIFLAVLLVGCEVPDDPETIELTIEDSGRIIAMNLEDEITVSLETHSSEGYTWVNMLTEGSSLVQDGEPVSDCPPFPKPGDSCIQTFTFQAVNSGSGAIKLQCIRLWLDEVDTEPLETFDVKVYVHR